MTFIELLLSGLLLASFVFVLDYVRSADLKFSYARLMLAINVNFAALAGAILLRSRGLLIAALVSSFLISVYQTVLLHRARKNGKRITEVCPSQER